MSHLLSDVDRPTVQLVAKEGPNAPIRRRAEILLLYDRGLKTGEVAARMSQTPHTVLRWRREYRKDGMAVFPQRALNFISESEDDWALFPAEPEDNFMGEDSSDSTWEEGPGAAPQEVADESGKSQERMPAVTVVHDSETTLNNLLARLQATGPHSLVIIVQQQAPEKKEKKKKKMPRPSRKPVKKGGGIKEDGKKSAKKKAVKKKDAKKKGKGKGKKKK